MLPRQRRQQQHCSTGACGPRPPHAPLRAAGHPHLHALPPHPPPPAQVTDGAAAVMLMTRREALRRGLPVLGIFRSFAAVGVPPAIMGIGPAVAIPAAVRAAGLAMEDIDVFEINEAFASQVWVGGWCGLGEVGGVHGAGEGVWG